MKRITVVLATTIAMAVCAAPASAGLPVVDQLGLTDEERRYRQGR